MRLIPLIHEGYEPTTLLALPGEPPDTGEHGVKASDLRAKYGSGPWAPDFAPVLVSVTDKPARVQGAKSDLLKQPNTLCRHCNTTATQRYDRAYETFATYLRDHQADVVRRMALDFRKIYGPSYRRRIPNLLGYFMKAMGCALAADGPPPGREYVERMGSTDTTPFGLIPYVNTTLMEQMGDNAFSLLEADWVGNGQAVGVLHTGYFEFRTWWQLRPKPPESAGDPISFAVRRARMNRIDGGLTS